MRWGLAGAVAIIPGLACITYNIEMPPLRAFGNEPFWNVTIAVADSIVYQRMGEADISFPYEASDYVEGDSVLAIGPLHDATGLHQIEIRILGGDCQDTMADIVHPMRALVTIDDEDLSGCASFQDSEAAEERP